MKPQRAPSRMLLAVVGLGSCTCQPERGQPAGPSAAREPVVAPRAVAGAAGDAAGASAVAAGDDAAAGTRGAEAGAVECEAMAFAESVDLAEASGAVYLPGDPPILVVVGDSGTRGAYAVLDADTGATLATGKLALDRGASDDLEGLSARGDTLYAITSSGWVRHWRRVGGGFEPTQAAYPVAEPGSELACKSADKTNCGPNYEGLCLDPGPVEPGACAGVAISKERGTAQCLTLGQGGRLAADPARRIEVGPGEALTGCHIDPDTGDLLVGANLFAASAVYRVRGWRQPAGAQVERLGRFGPGFPEALAAAPGGVVYRFSDTARAPSLLSKHRCR